MKKIPLLLLLLLPAASCTFKFLDGEETLYIHDGYSLSISFDHPDQLYDVGEPILATISFTHNGKALDNSITVETSKDNYAPTVETRTLSMDGHAQELLLQLDEPGFLMVKATCKIPDGPTITKLACAGVDIYGIRRSLEEPDDFMAYWDGQKQAQRALEDHLTLTPVSTTVKGVSAYDLQADCLAGPFSAYIAIPENAGEKSLPAIVLCHGAGVASSRLSVAAAWAAEGFIAIDFNVHGLPNGMPSEYYSALGAQGGALFQYYLNGTESRDEIFFRYMILRLVKAIDTATARPEWDGENLIIFGRSQGGGQAIIGGGIDERVNLICAEIPAICDMTGFLVDRASGWPRFASTLKAPLSEAQIQTIRYIDAMNFAAHCRAEAYFTVGFIDVTCPPTSVLSAFNTLPGEKHIRHNLNTGHSTTPEAEAYVHDAVIRFIQSRKP